MSARSMAMVPHAFAVLAAFTAVAALVACAGEASRIVAADGGADPELIASRWNVRSLSARAEPPFRFFVGGHIYGQPGPNRARPASTFAAGLEGLRTSGADLFVMLGDTVFALEEPELSRLQGLLGQLPFPVFNAPGNHELGDRQAYVARFGPTWSAFDHGGCRFVLIDTELDPWFVSGAQLEFLTGEIERALDPETRPRAFFVFGHKPIWATTENTAVAALASNTPDALVTFATRPAEAPTFGRDVRPLLRSLAVEIPVWCFAGDVGAFEERTLHLFMAKDDEVPGLRYLAAGLGDLDRDALLEVTVPGDGEPEVVARELRSGRRLDLEAFDSAHWMPRFLPDGLPAAVRPFLERD